MIIGYARVSSTDQSLDIQRAQLCEAGAGIIFEEKKSGANRDKRTALSEAIRRAEPGDELVVVRLDRLARSVVDLWNILKQLEAKQVTFRCLLQSLETQTPAGRLTVSILGAVAEFELDLKRERQAEGIAAARAAGKYKKEPKVSRRKMMSLKLEGLSNTEIARRLECNRRTVDRALPPGWGLPPRQGGMQ